MKLTFFRRRGLGLTSVREISNFMKNEANYVRNDQTGPGVLDDTNILVRWGCTSTSGLKKGTLTLNNSDAIHTVGNKLEFRRKLQEHKLCPFTFFDVKDAVYPCIVRPSTHAQGKNLYVCNDIAELNAAIAKCGQWYGAEIINKSAEFRVFVGSGRAVWVANKIPANPTDIAWNVAQGGRFENVRFGDWNLNVVRVAIEGFKLSGLDFGGVDVIVDQEGNATIVEINSAPSQTSPYRQQCCAKFFDYIVENGNATIELQETKGGWRKFIHPGVSSEAIK